MTQKQLNMIGNYNRATANELYQVYDKCSSAKIKSFESIKLDMLKNDGWSLKITGHNSNSYSCGYLFSDKLTGVVKLKYFTFMNTYEMDYL